jgi:hypothetical protein
LLRGYLDEILQWVSTPALINDDTVLKPQTGIRHFVTLVETTRVISADLLSGHVLQLEGDAAFCILVSESGTAVLIDWAGLRALLTGGVPLAEIEFRSRNYPQGISVQVLDDADLKNHAFENWIALFPQAFWWVGQGGAS